MSLYPFHTVEKEPMHRHRRFRRIAAIVRTAELCIALTLLSWSLGRWSTLSSSSSPSVADYITVAVQFSSDFLRRISLLFLSPHFVFLIGNAIILTLLLHSTAPAGDRNASAGQAEFESAASSDRKHIAAPAEVEASTARVEERYAEEFPRRRVLVRKRRTRSAELEVEKVSAAASKERSELRRSETEPRRKMERFEGYESAEEVTRTPPGDDDVEDLSSEEFQRKVEAFIARQQRFLREESMSAVFTSGISV